MLGTKQVWGGQPGAGGTWVSHLGVLGFRQDCAPKAHPSAVPQERQNIIRYWLENLRAKQGEALHNIHFLEGQPISEYGTAQHGTVWHSTAQYSTAQYGTAWHSMAQHSTAQYGAARHSTAHHSTARHSIAQLPRSPCSPTSLHPCCAVAAHPAVPGGSLSLLVSPFLQHTGMNVGTAGTQCCHQG